MPKSRKRKPKSADTGKPLDYYRKLVKLALRQEGKELSDYSHRSIAEAAQRLKAHTEDEFVQPKGTSNVKPV